MLAPRTQSVEGRKALRRSILWTLPLIALSLSASAQAASSCSELFGKKVRRTSALRPETEVMKHGMPGMKVGSVTDPTLATGVTLFLFDKGATAAHDSRGGSVASIETSLLEPGSYSNEIDGVMFSGGSTMGLEASQGARKKLFVERGRTAGVFDAIPSIPGAVVYDFGGRIEKRQDKLRYPTIKLGEAAFDQAIEGQMTIGRVGAGTTTTANKISSPIWGGQGAGYKQVKFRNGYKMKLFTAVILNAHGDITLPPDVRVDPEMLSALRKQAAEQTNGHRKNTTLSLVVTDVSLDRSQLQRLATMVHTSMAGVIHPFHSYTDGDILFAVSLHKQKLPKMNAYAFEEILQLQASELMKSSIIKSVMVSNKLGTPNVSGEDL